MNDQLPTIQNGTPAIDFSSAEVVKVLKQTVAQGATDAEFSMFAEMCKSTGLNPFKKEIWFIKSKNGVQMMTGINGYLTIANKHPQFDGMECYLENENGKLVGATCKVYRKDRKYPATATVYMEEYNQGSYIWKQKPRMMIQKVAKSVALREAFPQELAGTYTAEEMPDDFKPRGETTAPPPEKAKAKTVEEYIFLFTNASDEQEVWLRDKMVARYGGVVTENNGLLVYTVATDKAINDKLIPYRVTAQELDEYIAEHNAIDDDIPNWDDNDNQRELNV